jgi:hypothetical protein
MKNPPWGGRVGTPLPFYFQQESTPPPAYGGGPRATPTPASLFQPPYSGVGTLRIPVFPSEVPEETMGDRLRKNVRYSCVSRGVPGQPPSQVIFNRSLPPLLPDRKGNLPPCMALPVPGEFTDLPM